MIRAKGNVAAKLFATLGLIAAMLMAANAVHAQEAVRRESPVARPISSRTASQSARPTTLISPEWFENRLADPALGRIAAARFAAHHRLTRTDMQAIFAAAADGETI